jgi:hypothetical protein
MAQKTKLKIKKGDLVLVDLVRFVVIGIGRLVEPVLTRGAARRKRRAGNHETHDGKQFHGCS